MPSILLVCTANQCRSPMAMALLRKRLADLDLGDKWEVNSAGTWGLEGVPATENAIRAMQERGLELTDHHSRKVTEALLSSYDLVLTMESFHKEAIQIEFPNHASKVYMLSEMIEETWDVKDPVGHSLEDYRATADLIDRTLQEGMERILEQARVNAKDRMQDQDRGNS
jgi:protein-tyrosine phosphatase